MSIRAKDDTIAAEYKYLMLITKGLYPSFPGITQHTDDDETTFFTLLNYFYHNLVYFISTPERETHPSLTSVDAHF